MFKSIKERLNAKGVITTILLAFMPAFYMIAIMLSDNIDLKDAICIMIGVSCICLSDFYCMLISRKNFLDDETVISWLIFALLYIIPLTVLLAVVVHVNTEYTRYCCPIMFMHLLPTCFGPEIKYAMMD